ncbi:hypothetical protein [Litchfieldella xinjiangensis]|uniref:hypothetical protein n=1 Tax=Litchfieldella xinjiangensis TaxID=1166948 RepID=UPI00069446DE|nr:hypothetical protein [Halomonas xinjiangensis]
MPHFIRSFTWLAITSTTLLASHAVSASEFEFERETALPIYAAKDSEIIAQDSGITVEGAGLASPDGYTSGFRVTAGMSPHNFPHLDFGAEFAYRESDDVPSSMGRHSVIVDTVTMGGALVAGLRLGRFGVYAKSGFAEWEGNAVTHAEGMERETGGTSRVQGLGARMQFRRLVSRLEYEEISAPSMAHLNLITASIHFPF